ncbi:OLC1v1020416C1 [Oldenlandia corymbosa var. corymbosa]|uniref:OLC1v1020416C1 n=1 Tax=Oldenlandia corymbosa var. corymbosa TaxID=529605 RepID=A0AAV1EGH9_OLDCO|nr:OLC1v1020416C1 [Oldenlandia corymbosa var. corymbosa]
MFDCVLSFPEDLITDILVRLPVKSIDRFRRVSKSWQSLLSSPRFIKDHLAFHNLGDPEKLIFTDASDHSPVMLTFTTENRGGSRNNGVSKKLICPSLPRNEWAKGLGYDESSDDYKIVTLSYFYTDNEHEPDCAETFVDIYSVKMKTWKRPPASPYDHAVPQVAHGVFVSGCLHWLACDIKTKGHPSVIAAFDLGHEKFEKVPPPIGVDESKFVFNELIVLGGCLALIVDSYDGVVDVWVMKEYGVQESGLNLPSTILQMEMHVHSNLFVF